MEPHSIVTVTVTTPWGDVSTHNLGTVPTWAGIDSDWKRSRRPMVLDDLGCSDRPGFKFRWALTDEGEV